MNPIRVLGWYNHANIGDEAYKLAFASLFPVTLRCLGC